MEDQTSFIQVLLNTVKDVLPILFLILFFQLVVIRKKVPNPRSIIIGSVLVVVGLAFFLLGLEKALFPIGDIMAKQLTDPEFLHGGANETLAWHSYYWTYIFAALIGFASSLAEPSLIAIAYKAHEVSAGTISQWGLRITVATGVAVAMALGTFRIVTGTPLFAYILVGYAIVIVQTIFASKQIIALAYDSGGVTTSTVIVPLITALGLGLANQVPGRNPLNDGFGMIALACLFPIIAVLAYVQIMEFKVKSSKRKSEK